MQRPHGETGEDPDTGDSMQDPQSRSQAQGRQWLQKRLTGRQASGHSEIWEDLGEVSVGGKWTGYQRGMLRDFFFRSFVCWSEQRKSWKIKAKIKTGKSLSFFALIQPKDTIMTNLDSILKSRDITLPTKVHLVKAMIFPVVMYGCESLTVKKAEH